MGSLEYLNFLRRSHKIISSEIVGLNLVVLKEPYENPQLVITPQMKKNEETGVEEIEFAQLIYKNFAVKIYDKLNRVF